MKNINVCAAAILRDHKLFAAKRGYGPHIGWELPGGKIRENETSREAVIREIREELSCEIKPYEYAGRIEHDYDDFHLSMDVWLCHLCGGEPVLSEHTEAGWFDASRLDEVDWLAADRKIMPVIRNRMAGYGEEL